MDLYCAVATKHGDCDYPYKQKKLVGDHVPCLQKFHRFMLAKFKGNSVLIRELPI